MVQIHSPRPFLLASTISITGKSREHPKSAWYETRRSCLMSVGREGSLCFEFIALQREIHVTDNPLFEKVGTGSDFWKKNQKRRFKSCVSAMRHSAR
jgi:hypothetical protein